jgi:hypothetical protein
MPIDQPPAIVQPAQLEKRVTVHRGRGGWWSHIEGHGYPFGAWRMDRGPYPFKWMAGLDFPIERWKPKEGPVR